GVGTVRRRRRAVRSAAVTRRGRRRVLFLFVRTCLATRTRTRWGSVAIVARRTLGAATFTPPRRTVGAFGRRRQIRRRRQAGAQYVLQAAAGFIGGLAQLAGTLAVALLHAFLTGAVDILRLRQQLAGTRRQLVLGLANRPAHLAQHVVSVPQFLFR